MAIPLAVGAAVGLAPSLFKLFQGIGQKRAANKINPVNPGYTMNSGVIDNARVLGERASNYTMPGLQNTINQINGVSANAFNQGIQGASSGGDVLDLATKLAYGQQQQFNQLGQQNAIGADQALLQSLEANALAGQQYQDKNAYDRQMYDRQLAERAALTQAGNQNIYGAIDTAATIGTTFLNPRKTMGGGSLTPEQIAGRQAYYKAMGGQ